MNEQTQTEIAVENRKPEKPEFSPPSRSAAETALRRIMKARGMNANGKGYKNFAIVTANGVQDADGFVACETAQHDPITGDEVDIQPFICHKRHLHRFVGAEQAKRWWSALGVRAHRRY